jgi:hypothetical protein
VCAALRPHVRPLTHKSPLITLHTSHRYLQEMQRDKLEESKESNMESKPECIIKLVGRARKNKLVREHIFGCVMFRVEVADLSVMFDV